jgi:hypothetical protein
MNLRNTADGALDDAFDRHINHLMDAAFARDADEGAMRVLVAGLQKAGKTYEAVSKALDGL